MPSRGARLTSPRRLARAVTVSKATGLGRAGSVRRKEAPGLARGCGPRQRAGLGAPARSSEPLISREGGSVQRGTSPCSMARYLECPGQHPHRHPLHGLPLLEMRRAELVPGAAGPAAGAPRRPSALGRSWRTDPSCEGVRLSKDSEKGLLAKVSRSLEKKIVPYFWRKRILCVCFFLQKYLFLPKPEFELMS